MKKVRFGIVGVGTQGRKYVKEIFNEGKVENGELVAICDTDPRAIEITTGELGFTGAVFTDYKEMIDSGVIDAVMIEVPHYSHPEMSIYALEHGVHVLCEKPAGVYTKQVKEMNEVAKKSDKLFGLMFNQRTKALYCKMREMILAGEIGEVKRINWIITDWFRSEYYYNACDWRATWAGEGGGTLLNQCPHQLDLIQWIVDMSPKKVHAFCSFGKWHDIEVEDEVVAYMEYENGATGVFVTTTSEAGGTNRLEVVGNNGKLVAEGKSLTFTKLAVGSREFSKTTDKQFGEPEKTITEVEVTGGYPAHAGIINNFANAVLGIEPLYVDGTEGIKGVELMDAMLLSTFLDRAVELPIDDDLYLAELQKRIANSRPKGAKK